MLYAIIKERYVVNKCTIPYLTFVSCILPPVDRVRAHLLGLDLLAEEGYIWNYEVKTEGKFPEIQVKVKYSDNGTPALTDLKRMSKPGLRQYVGAGEVPRVLNGLGITIVSTSKGVMTGAKAVRQNVGGELIAKVW